MWRRRAAPLLLCSLVPRLRALRRRQRLLLLLWSRALALHLHALVVAVFPHWLLLKVHLWSFWWWRGSTIAVTGAAAAAMHIILSLAVAKMHAFLMVLEGLLWL